jgi:hypothetical protein
VFFADSASPFNATDPLSVTATPAGKRRYGFELGGPITQKKSDVFLALEKRDIDEFQCRPCGDIEFKRNSCTSATSLTRSATAVRWVGTRRLAIQTK